MRVLVVGGNGFIGSHLVDKLIQLNHQVIVFDANERRFDPIPSQVHFIKGDINQLYLVREALLGVEIVYYLAWTNIHEVSNQDPALDINSNLVPAIRFIETCNRMGNIRFVFISSGGTIYGPTEVFPIPETHPQNPITSYGITKLAVEKYLGMFHDLYGLDYVVLRPSVPYGPRQNPLLRQGAVSVFMYNIAHDIPISIWGNGEITRDYFYISDLIDAFLACMNLELHNERVINIGGGIEISLNHLIKSIEPILNKKAIVQYYPKRDFDAPRILLDTQLAKKLLNWYPKVPLTDGLKILLHWMSQNFE